MSAVLPPTEQGETEPSDAAYFTCCNRNKESVCIDFSTPEGAELMRKLARTADILVENFYVRYFKQSSEPACDWFKQHL